MIASMMSSRNNQNISSLVDNFHVAYPDYIRMGSQSKRSSIQHLVEFDFSKKFLLQRSQSKLKQLYYDQYGDYYHDDSDEDSIFEQGLNKVPSKLHLEPNRDGVQFKRRKRSGYETQQRERVHEKNQTIIDQSTDAFAKDIINNFQKKI